MTTSEQVHEIAAACVKAQQELKPAIKDAVNPTYKSKYADLPAVIEASRVYATHGVAIFQEATTVPGGVSVSTRLIHDKGQWIAFDGLTVPCSTADAHSIGSATTYAKRYALSAACVIAADKDDDGNAAVGVSPVAAPVTVPDVPDGFEHFVRDLEKVAAKGTDALKLAWKQAQPYMRKHLTDTDPAKWDALKAKADQVPVAASV